MQSLCMPLLGVDCAATIENPFFEQQRHLDPSGNRIEERLGQIGAHELVDVQVDGTLGSFNPLLQVVEGRIWAY